MKILHDLHDNLHRNAVRRIVSHVDGGDDIFTALPPGYRAFEEARRKLIRNSRPRREERTEIYQEASQFLGQRAVFVVMLMWAYREDHLVDQPVAVEADEIDARIRGKRIDAVLEQEGEDTKLVKDGVILPKIDYEIGRRVMRSHIDRVVVTERNGRPTRAKLGEFDAREHIAFSLVFGQEPEGY